ncbi:hypothetical protein A0J52_06865 [Clostridium sporogenes]|uniref:hypothetical protein n=1 Tax=Clostridium sporogenes TaxID=1509 RepID=UPI00077FEF70|nr:hypothetical protein [Clostridium sporogenes]KYN78991.1 hypothetical protein A0J52_06865 [Clostridium sporogenes]MBW5459315.1 hypothetical protein [Clostridium sporogenes]
MEKASKYLLDTSRPGGARSSVRYGNRTRFFRAEEQARLKIIEIPKIIDYTNEFLGLLGMDSVITPKRERESLGNNLYKEIKKNNNLEDERDIVWMKFTEDGFLGVVATSNDINFDIPLSEKEYDKKHNTSGIIIHYLEKKWDESFVLIFPLQEIPEKLKRGDVERGIGNYLIKKGVPILDFFSHRY